MKPPILVCDMVDVLIFETVQAVESYLEPWHIHEQCSGIFDSDGKVLQQSVAKRKVKCFFGLSTTIIDMIHLDDSGESNPEKLKELLREYMRGDRDPTIANANYDNLDLASLIEITLKRIGYTR